MYLYVSIFILLFKYMYLYCVFLTNFNSKNLVYYEIKANYPDSYKAELRNWGFQKEKY